MDDDQVRGKPLGAQPADRSVGEVADTGQARVDVRGRTPVGCQVSVNSGASIAFGASREVAPGGVIRARFAAYELGGLRTRLRIAPMDGAPGHAEDDQRERRRRARIVHHERGPRGAEDKRLIAGPDPEVQHATCAREMERQHEIRPAHVVRWIFALAVVLVAAWGAPSAAALTPSVVARRVPESGPVLAGSDVVWLENRSSSNAVLVVIARPGRNVVVRRLRPPVPPVGASIDEAFGDGVIASPGFVGVVRHLTVCGPPGYVCGVSDDLLAGPLGGGLSVLASDARCQGGAITAESASLSGNVIAYAEGPSSCASSAPARIVVRDLRRPHRSRVIGAVASYPGTAAVRAAGRFVAWSDPTPSASAIVVYDLAAGRVAYRLTPRHLGTDEILGWDLQSDGKLAVAYNRAGRRSLAWLAMPDARVHRLAGASPGSSGVGPSDASLRIARDEIAFVQHGSTLTLMDLGGHAQLIRRFTEKRAEIGGFDFDGQRLVWAEQDIKYIEVHCPTSGSGPCEGKAIGPTFILSQRTAPPASPDDRASERSTGRRKAKA